jgi:hypothetical protein
MKHPLRSDFDTAVTEAGVNVTFKPTGGVYSFYRLAETDDLASLGPVSFASTSFASVQHAEHNTDEYSPDELQDMAQRIASEVVTSLSRVQDEEETDRLTTVRPPPVLGDEGD